jgi:PAS domain S-box-containing protein
MRDRDKSREEILRELRELQEENQRLRELNAERHKVEQALRRSKERFEELVELLPVFVYQLDEKGNFTFMNRAGLEGTGYTENDQGVNFLKAFVPVDQNRVVENFLRVLRGERVRGNEYTAVRKDGTTFPVVTYSVPIVRKGKIKGIRGVAVDITEHKRAQEELWRSEEKYRTIIETIEDGYYEVDLAGKFIFVNEAVCRALGYSREELLCLGNRDFMDESSAAKTYAAFNQVYRTGEARRMFQCELTSKDGQRKHVALSISLVKDADGSATGFRGICRDTSDLKRAEDALTQSEVRYRGLFEDSPVALWEVDMSNLKAHLEEIKQAGVTDLRDHFSVNPNALWQAIARVKVLDVNRATLHLYQAKEKDKLVRNVEKLIPSQSRDAMLDNLMAVSLNRLEFEAESIHRTLSGDERDVYTRWSVAPGCEETFSRVLVSIVDITESKRAEKALRESEEKYRLVVENAYEAILIAQDGMLSFANPRGAELIGYSEQELTSTPFVNFIHPEDREMVADRHRRRLKGETPPNVYSFRVIDKKGNIKWVELNAIPITWEGKPATLNFLEETTSRRKIEEELLKVEKLESLGILAGGIAHDFNNILTAILGNIALAKLHERTPEKVTNKLTEAERACLRAQSLTQQLLTFSKGGAPIRKTLFISETIRDSCLFALRGSNSRCEFSIADNLYAVEADEGQIGQVLNNLVINADQAMPQGGVIHMRAENVTMNKDAGLPLNEGKYVKLVVTDQGIGIPERILPRIFDPYFTTKQKGSGLGLATSYSIIKNHDGLITVESEPEGGTTFSVYLPASQSVISRPADSEEAPDQGRGKILLMDDEEPIRELAREMLSLLGYEVETAKDGAEAIDLYRAARETSHPFDAVILDLTVSGGMGGRETIERLLELDPQVNAIVSSGYGNDPIMAEHERYGFRGVVAKPYTAKELSETIKGVLAGNAS